MVRKYNYYSYLFKYLLIYVILGVLIYNIGVIYIEDGFFMLMLILVFIKIGI